MRVSSAEFLKKYGQLTDRALTEPVTITRHGRDRFVLVAAEEFARLKRRDRKVVATGELTEEDIELIRKAEVPPEYAYLDEELKEPAA